MKITKVQIKNLYGIKETDLDGRAVELTGPKGAGKTSVLDSIRYALTNKSDRDLIVREGAEEGEIFIETSAGVTIDRKKRTNKSDYIKVQENNKNINRPAEFLSEIFTPLQLNPVEFTQMSNQEKNKVILSLIEFEWDTNWIQEQFGEIPQGVDYSKHILEVLADIQSESGFYYKTRQDVNRDIRNNIALVQEIAHDIPENYQFEKWKEYNVGEKYKELSEAKELNNTIDRANEFKANYTTKLNALEAKRDLDISHERESIAFEKEEINSKISALKERLAGLTSELEIKEEHINERFKSDLEKLEKDTNIANKWVAKASINTEVIQKEIDLAESMKSHLNEYERMTQKQSEISKLQDYSNTLTEKIELARSLPGDILKSAVLPIEGLSVENGVPLINGLPISNLSDGELLELCVDVSVNKPGKLQIILIDGAERLDSKSRDKLYDKCREKGLQIIATRVTDSDELEVTYL